MFLDPIDDQLRPFDRGAAGTSEDVFSKLKIPTITNAVSSRQLPYGIRNMDENIILNQIAVLKIAFDRYSREWIYLKQHVDFLSLPHSSHIRDLYAEGRGEAEAIRDSLNLDAIGKTILLNDFVFYVKLALTDLDRYDRICNAARDEFLKLWQSNSVVRTMLEICDDQREHTVQLANLLESLKTTPTFQLLEFPPKAESPISVIGEWAKLWEENAQLHEKADEVGLRSQLIAALKKSRFIALPEAHAYLGHADIVIPKVNDVRNNFRSAVEAGNDFVGECKFWRGENKFDEAISQLCRYTTEHDRHSALIVFVRNSSFESVVEKAKVKLESHPAFGGWRAQSEVPYGFFVRPAQSAEKLVPATILFCNLSIVKY